MSCEAKTFQNIDAKAFEALKGKLDNAGLQISGNAGTIQGPMGIVMEYSWDESAATLYTKVQEKSFFVPCSQINSILQKAINDCLSQA